MCGQRFFLKNLFFTFPFSLSAYRKDQHLLSPVNCWYLVLTQTRRESRDHATLNDIFMNNVIVRLSQISEDVIRLFKKVKVLFTISSLAKEGSYLKPIQFCVCISYIQYGRIRVDADGTFFLKNRGTKLNKMMLGREEISFESCIVYSLPTNKEICLGMSCSIKRILFLYSGLFWTPKMYTISLAFTCLQVDKDLLVLTSLF